jgi:hypothetical protein
MKNFLLTVVLSVFSLAASATVITYTTQPEAVTNYLEGSWTFNDNTGEITNVYIENRFLYSIYNAGFVTSSGKFRFYQLGRDTLLFVDVWTTSSSPTYFLSNDNAFAYAGWSQGSTKWEVASTVSEVPVPATAWLMGSGLVGLAGIARRKK